MKIVIPMSGFGNRFVQAGYTDPKPLIIVDGKPIIEHVVNLFPGETDFIFICNKTHLETTNMREILTRIKPDGIIKEIEPHKLGPVHALSVAYEDIPDDEEVIVNYCDFGTYWNYSDFLKHTRTRNADGAIPSYKGFHPHMLGSDNYAFMRDENQWMLEIQEKKPFTDNKMNEYASNGTYYFRTGAIMKKYCSQLIEEGVDLNGEYYVSCVYNLLIKDNLKVSIYEIEHMLQWGTPKDLEIYKSWSRLFYKLNQKYPMSKVRTAYKGMTIIPMAGKGSRFSEQGYTTPKPLIEVNGKPMVIAATDCLPMTTTFTEFICLEEHIKNNDLINQLNKHKPFYNITTLDKVTTGQASTIYEGIIRSKNCNMEEKLIIGTCDSGHLHNNLLPDADVLVYTFRNNPAVKNNPNAYSYIDVNEDGNALSVSMKKPISDHPSMDHAITGAFVFNKAKFFVENYINIVEKGIMFNNEHYADLVVQECIDNGLNVKVLEVDEYLCWGTPEDYQTYLYWQSFFHKCDYHPYSLDKDPLLNKNKLEEYVNKVNKAKTNKV
jgi:NDP-sugar pyrophosphorylase family protein